MSITWELLHPHSMSDLDLMLQDATTEELSIAKDELGQGDFDKPLEIVYDLIDIIDAELERRGEVKDGTH